MPARTPEALLFDLGGVLIDIDFRRAINAWSPYSSLTLDELHANFKHDLQYERHERGEVSANEYFDYLATTLQLAASREQIESGWNAIYVREITETRTLIEAMRPTIPCYAFTNTNASHTEAWSALYPKVVGAFDHIFKSHELGLRKPDRAAFCRVCDLIGKATDSVIFFDDLLENVEAATSAGLQGVLVRSPADVSATMRSFGLPGAV